MNMVLEVDWLLQKLQSKDRLIPLNFWSYKSKNKNTSHSHYHCCCFVFLLSFFLYEVSDFDQYEQSNQPPHHNIHKPTISNTNEPTNPDSRDDTLLSAKAQPSIKYPGKYQYKKSGISCCHHERKQKTNTTGITHHNQPAPPDSPNVKEQPLPQKLTTQQTLERKGTSTFSIQLNGKNRR